MASSCAGAIANVAPTGVRPDASARASSASNASISLDFILRLMGPRLAVPSVKAGGAVEEPAAWIWMLTLG